MKKIIALILTASLMLGLCACTKLGDTNSSKFDSVVLNDDLLKEDIQSSANDDLVDNVLSSQNNQNVQSNANNGMVSNNNSSVSDANNSTVSNNNSSQVNQSTNQTQNNTNDTVSSNNASSQETASSVDENASAIPEFNLCAQVASNTYIVGGVCSKDTEYVTIGGAGVKSVKITPTKGETGSYFITQVNIDFNTTIEVQGKEIGKNISNKSLRFVTTNSFMKNRMTDNDYAAVFGLDNRMHYYSSILSYTLSDKVDDGIKQIGISNITETVNAAKNTNAEVIYLVVPSSAAVYPETVPSEYKAATGESIYEAFESVAIQCGAKVIYPLDIMKAHKNDGDGYKIFSHTDSHWTTYGAYWGVNALMSHISDAYPTAKPRTVSEMGFYTAELYAGDALFSFGDNNGFENYSMAASTNGETKVTRIKEFTTLYNLKMPTDTLSKITRGKKSVYLTKDNEGANTETNPNGSGLPTAVVVRDSFARTAYDMINDRFSVVNWLSEGDYTSVVDQINSSQPNYVIYIVSERNLVKVMLNNKNISLTSLQ